MKIRWMILFFPVVSVIVLSLAVMQHAAKAAPPQAPAAAATKAATAPDGREQRRGDGDPRHDAGHQFATSRCRSGSCTTRSTRSMTP